MADHSQSSSRKRVRDDPDVNSGELELELVKRLRDDLLGVLDDSDLDPVGQDLDSVMRSFQQEISAPSTSPSSPAAFVDLTSESGGSPSQLGYLLEASDDELGLPPSSDASGDEAAEPAGAPSESSGFVEFWGLESFDDQIPSYDSFEFISNDDVHGGDDYAVFDDWLFGFDGGCMDPSGVSDYFWRSETLPGL